MPMLCQDIPVYEDLRALRVTQRPERRNVQQLPKNVIFGMSKDKLKTC